MRRRDVSQGVEHQRLGVAVSVLEHGYRDGGPASATHLVVTVADPLEELDGGITHSKHGSILPVRT
jgi:hypothetical protein